jgi:chemotaxis family two-component system response regulator Rcp1
MGANGGRGPDLVILDLNLPGKTGRQIMAEMEVAAELRALPVAVLTTSHNESGIGKEFPGLRSTFAAKTPDFRQLVEIIERFKEFAKQPSRSAP